MNGLTYFRPVVIDNYIFMSCDMLRLKFEMLEDRLKSFNKFINAYMLEHVNIRVTPYYNTSKFRYRNLLVVSDMDSKHSISFGLQFNDLSKVTNDCFIEFNPNKTLDEYGTGLAQVFLDYIKRYSIGLELVRYDLAIDIPIDRQFVSLNKDMRKYSKLWCSDIENSYTQILQDMDNKKISYKIEVKSKDLSNCTEYLGQRNISGFVKLYNKQIESNLNNLLTRLEITMDTLNYSDFEKNLPNVKVFKDISSEDISSLNDTERVLLKLLQQNSNCDLYLKQLGRKMQDKLKKILYANYSIVDRITKENYFQLVSNISEIVNI